MNTNPTARRSRTPKGIPAGGQFAAETKSEPTGRLDEETVPDPEPETVTYVDPCPGLKGTDTITETCGRCGGTGTFHFGRVTFDAILENGSRQSGRWCFECNGNGTITRKVKNIRAAEHRRVNAENEALRQAADYEAHREEREAAAAADQAEEAARRQDREDQFATDHPAEADVLATMDGEFATDLRERIRQAGELTDNQLAVLTRIADERANEPDPSRSRPAGSTSPERSKPPNSWTTTKAAA